MSKTKYAFGRNLILYTVLAEALITLGHIFDHQVGVDFLLIGNLLSHVTAPVFFIGIAYVLYGLGINKEYQRYTFSIWDLVAIALVVLTAPDFWYTIVTPHPLFHDSYGI